MASGFGAFGKIPSMGDFLRVNLSAGFVQTWDEWLQNGLLALREGFGQAWNDYYMSAPIWRFTMPAGHAGDHAYCGVLMASVDRVGRQYPLTLACPVAPASAAAIHLSNDALFEKLEDTALAALEDDCEREALMASVAGLEVHVPKSASLSGSHYVGGQSPAASMAAWMVDQNYGNVALWSTEVGGDHRMLFCQALPNRAELAAMFDLNAQLWQQAPMAQNA